MEAKINPNLNLQPAERPDCKEQPYTAPEATVTEIKLEKGFAISGIPGGDWGLPIPW